jgi:hypothetical protein
MKFIKNLLLLLGIVLWLMHGLAYCCCSYCVLCALRWKEEEKNTIAFHILSCKLTLFSEIILCQSDGKICSGLVFLLKWKYCRSKLPLIQEPKHFFLKRYFEIKKKCKILYNFKTRKKKQFVLYHLEF